MGYLSGMNDSELNKPQRDSERRDAQSDPSLDDGESADWSGEGGATPDGPATADPANDAATDNPDET